MKFFPLFFSALLVFPVISRGQIETVLPVSTAKTGSLTAVAYDWEVIGVNPANLGWKVNHKLSVAILNIGMAGQSRGMSFPGLMNLTSSQGLLSSADNAQQILGVPHRMYLMGDIEWFAVSFKIPTIPGAFAVNMRDRISGNAMLGNNTPQAIINSEDQTISDVAMLTDLNGTTLNFYHYREINLDYGLPLFKIGGDSKDDLNKCFTFSNRDAVDYEKATVYGGIGLKYLIGIADVNADVANSAINALYYMNSEYPNLPPKGFFNMPGNGFALDLGLSVVYKRWKFGVSATDYGSITWKRGAVTSGDTAIHVIHHGSDFWNELNSGTLAGSVPAPHTNIKLPFKLRTGIAFQVIPEFLISADFIMPLNQSPMGINVPYGALGIQAKVSTHFTIYTGFAMASGYGWGIPLGASFGFGRHVKFYFGTNDITAYLGKPRNAEVSVAMGMLRYNL
jgi:hypothetical protein